MPEKQVWQAAQKTWDLRQIPKHFCQDLGLTQTYGWAELCERSVPGVHQLLSQFS